DRAVADVLDGALQAGPAAQAERLVEGQVRLVDRHQVDGRVDDRAVEGEDGVVAGADRARQAVEDRVEPDAELAAPLPAERAQALGEGHRPEGSTGPEWPISYTRDLGSKSTRPLTARVVLASASARRADGGGGRTMRS